MEQGWRNEGAGDRAGREMELPKRGDRRDTTGPAWGTLAFTTACVWGPQNWGASYRRRQGSGSGAPPRPGAPTLARPGVGSSSYRWQGVWGGGRQSPHLPDWSWNCHLICCVGREASGACERAWAPRAWGRLVLPCAPPHQGPPQGALCPEPGPGSQAPGAEAVLAQLLLLQQAQAVQLDRAGDEAYFAALLHQPPDPPVVIVFLQVTVGQGTKRGRTGTLCSWGPPSLGEVRLLPHPGHPEPGRGAKVDTSAFLARPILSAAW